MFVNTSKFAYTYVSMFIPMSACARTHACIHIHIQQQFLQKHHHLSHFGSRIDIDCINPYPLCWPFLALRLLFVQLVAIGFCLLYKLLLLLGVSGTSFALVFLTKHRFWPTDRGIFCRVGGRTKLLTAVVDVPSATRIPLQYHTKAITSNKNKENKSVMETPT